MKLLVSRRASYRASELVMLLPLLQGHSIALLSLLANLLGVHIPPQLTGFVVWEAGRTGHAKVVGKIPLQLAGWITQAKNPMIKPPY